MRRSIALAVAVVALSGVLVGSGPARAIGPPGIPRGGIDDATVVAVIDFTFAPYHWDYSAAKMPQALDSDPSNDLPLSIGPDVWLPGFPDASEFKSFNSLGLSLDDKNEMTVVETLDAKDKAKWDKVKPSTSDEINYYWMPGTKVIGALDFGGTKIHGPTTSHGTGTSSVSVGNIHGTCPECLLVFINVNAQADAEQAIDWAMSQPWIDAISNSYGFGTTPIGRERVYSGSNTALQKKASDRGQTIFFSAGNGVENAFLFPNTTLESSQEGPDWIVTVGAVSPGTHASYTGHGKPADIAGIGSGYPAAYGSPTVGGTGSGGFGGTSNATPTIAGTYARALYLARRAMAGASRTQTGGVIAKGRFKCGSVRPDCELGDGKLTAVELRTRLFHGALHTEAGLTPGGVGSAPRIGEEDFLSEGHGSYFARETGKVGDWLKEFGRLIGPLTGTAKALKRPEGEKEWMIVDSYCRQHLWGAWNHGYYKEGKTELPGDDSNYPTRSAIERSCPMLQPPQ